jgi:hypothetical protein
VRNRTAELASKLVRSALVQSARDLKILSM